MRVPHRVRATEAPRSGGIVNIDESPRKRTVRTYFEGFETGDHAAILSLLTDDVTWEMPGFFDLSGKEAFDAEIENDAFEGHPKLTVRRLVEEEDVVVAVGAVEAARTDGGTLSAVFADVFYFEGQRIHRLETYLMERRS
jgi:ketosteroid isomerase-like protein